METMFDVVAISLDNKTVRIMARDKDELNAYAVVDMAVVRRGVEQEYFSICRAGKYNDGDKFTTNY